MTTVETTQHKILPINTKVEVVGYNSFFQGLMGTVQGYLGSEYIVAIENGESFVHGYIDRDKRTPAGSYSFGTDNLRVLPTDADTTVLRVDPPRC